MKARDHQQSMQSIPATGWRWSDTNGWVSADQLHLSPPFGHLYDYVLASNFLVPTPIEAGLAADA